MRTTLRIAALLLWCCLPVAATAQQWKKQNSGITGDIRSVKFVDANTGCAAVWDEDSFTLQILRTTTGGNSWTTVFEDTPRGGTAIDFADNKKGVVVGGSFLYLVSYRTADAGASWTPQFADNQYVEGKPALWSISFGDDRTGYASAASGVVMKTTNAGETWSMLPVRVADNQEIIYVHFISATTGFAVAANTNDYFRGRDLYKTTDGAQSWQKIASLPLLRSVTFLNEDVGFAAGSSGGVPTIWKTVDGGHNWQIKYSGPFESPWLNSISFTPENPYVGYGVGGSVGAKDNGLIVRTIDGGETWTEEATNLPEYLYSVHFPTETSGYAVGAHGAIYKTVREPQPPPQPTIRVSEEELDFGELAVGETLELFLDISAGSPVPLEVATMGTDAQTAIKGFEVNIDGILPISVDYGDPLRVRVTCTPVQPGEATGILHITSNDKTTPEKEIPLRVSAYGVEQPGVQTSVNALHFGSVVIGEHKEMTVTISPKNDAGLDIESISIEPAVDGLSFTTSAPLPAQLFDASESLTATVRFAPVLTGTVYSQLIIRTNDAENSAISLALIGSASAATSVGEPDPASVGEPDPASLPGLTIEPNPIDERGTVRFSLPQSAHVSVALYTPDGALVRTLFSGHAEAGSHSLPVHTDTLSSGMYLCRLTAGTHTISRRLILVR